MLRLNNYPIARALLSARSSARVSSLPHSHRRPCIPTHDTGIVSRPQMLKWMGKALIGAVLFSIPGVAWAAPPSGRGRVPVGEQGCPQAGQSNCRGSCVFLSSDPNNCGACGNICAGGTSCSNGTCLCPTASQTNCGGTCVDLLFDPNNCGTCGNRCPEEDSCVFGTCQRCPESQIECDGICTDISTDQNNCGACGNICTSDIPDRPAVCFAGNCKLL